MEEKVNVEIFGERGDKDGTLSDFQIETPRGILFTKPIGTAYVCCQYSRCVKKINTRTGTVENLCGGNVLKNIFNYPLTIEDGIGKRAIFKTCISIQATKANVLYISDFHGSIRKVQPNGFVSTILNEERISPWGICLDLNEENLFVCDYKNHCIRKLELSNQATHIFAGQNGKSGHSDGVGLGATFSHPFGIARNKSGSLLYTSDSSNYSIRSIHVPTATVKTVIGSLKLRYQLDDPTAFKSLQGLVVDGDDNIFVVDSGVKSIKKISTIDNSVKTVFRGEDVLGTLTLGS